MLGQQILQADNRASSARQISLNHPLFPGERSLRIAPCDTRGSHNLIMRQFRDETKPSKHRFRPSGQTRRTSLQVTQVKSVVVSTCLEMYD